MDFFPASGTVKHGEANEAGCPLRLVKRMQYASAAGISGKRMSASTGISGKAR